MGAAGRGRSPYLPSTAAAGPRARKGGDGAGRRKGARSDGKEQPQRQQALQGMREEGGHGEGVDGVHPATQVVGTHDPGPVLSALFASLEGALRSGVRCNVVGCPADEFASAAEQQHRSERSGRAPLAARSTRAAAGVSQSAHGACREDALLLSAGHEWHAPRARAAADAAVAAGRRRAAAAEARRASALECAAAARRRAAAFSSNTSGRIAALDAEERALAGRLGARCEALLRRHDGALMLAACEAHKALALLGEAAKVAEACAVRERSEAHVTFAWDRYLMRLEEDMLGMVSFDHEVAGADTDGDGGDVADALAAAATALTRHALVGADHKTGGAVTAQGADVSRVVRVEYRTGSDKADARVSASADDVLAMADAGAAVLEGAWTARRAVKALGRWRVMAPLQAPTDHDGLLRALLTNSAASELATEGRVGGSSAGVYETATCRRPALLGVGRGGDQPASASGAGRRTARVRRAALARMLHVDDARNRASLGEASEVVVEDDDVDPCSARRFFPRGTSLAPMFPPRMRLTSKLLAWLQSPEAPQADARLFFCIEDWLRTHARVEHTVRGALGAHGASSVASAAAAPVAYSEFQPYAARDDVAESLASLPAAVALMASPLASTDGDAASSVAGSSVVTCSSLRDVVGGVLVLPRERNAAAASWTTGPALPPLHFAPASLQQLVEVGAVIDLLSEHEGTGEVLAAYDVEGTKRHGGGLANLYMLEAAPGVWEGSAGTSTAAITQHSRLGSTSGSRVSTSVLRPLTESEIRELTVVYLLRDGAIAEDAGAVWPASDRTGGGDRDGEEKADETGGVGREELGLLYKDPPAERLPVWRQRQSSQAGDAPEVRPRSERPAMLALCREPTAEEREVLAGAGSAVRAPAGHARKTAVCAVMCNAAGCIAPSVAGGAYCEAHGEMAEWLDSDEADRYVQRQFESRILPHAETHEWPDDAEPPAWWGSSWACSSEWVHRSSETLDGLVHGEFARAADADASAVVGMVGAI